MAGLALLDGTTAATDITIAPGTSYIAQGTAISVKGVLGYISHDIVREMFEQTVFSSGGWRQQISGMKQLIGRADGYESKGATYSDPLLYFANNFPCGFVYTADTSCTLTYLGFISRRHSGMKAAGNSEAGFDIASFGAVTSSWTTS